MTRRFEQLSADERAALASLHQQGQSLRSIARLVKRSPSTLSREMARNGTAQGYASKVAQAACQQRRLRSRAPVKLSAHGLLWQLVTTMLSWRWSPRQISQTKLSTTRSMPTLGGSFGAASSPACVKARAPDGHSVRALIARARSPRRSVSMFVLPRSMIE